MRPIRGLTFGGRYELSSRIAIGGMGEVWEATDLVIGRTVAIKILKDEYLGSADFLERFRAEARHAALVNHEGIANVYDYGEEDGSAYLVMELVPGESLSTLLERERVLPTDTVLDIIAQTAAALHAAHQAGLVHRDIKPGNLLMTPDGRVKITDFGIARIADQVPLTATGQVMGTVQYLSPEQASGHSATPSTDIYSLGIVAYEALAGKRPFTGESQVAIAMAQINDAPPPLPVTVAEPVRNLVLSCIAKKPADRPETCALLAQAANALRHGDVYGAAASVPQVLGGTAVPEEAINPQTAATQMLPGAGSPATVPTTTRSRSPWTWPLISLIGLLILVLSGTLIALLLQQPDEEEPTDTETTSEPTETETTPTETETDPEDEMVTVTASDYVRSTYETAVSLLRDKGLFSSQVAGSVAIDPNDVGRVQEVSPTGQVPKGSSIALTVWVAPGAPAAPGTPSTDTSPVTSGDEVTVTWPAASCPTGWNLTRYDVSVSGVVSPVTTTSITVTAGDPGTTIEVQLRVVCGTGSSALTSAFSPTLSIPVE